MTFAWKGNSEGGRASESGLGAEVMIARMDPRVVVEPRVDAHLPGQKDDNKRTVAEIPEAFGGFLLPVRRSRHGQQDCRGRGGVNLFSELVW